MSEIRTNTISNLVGTGPVTLTNQDPSKAYGNVSMDSVILAATFNVSSYTDTGTGEGSFNLTNAFSVAPTVLATSRRDAGGSSVAQRAGVKSVSSIGLRTLDQTGALADTVELSFSCFGVLA